MNPSKLERAHLVARSAVFAVINAAALHSYPWIRAAWLLRFVIPCSDAALVTCLRSWFKMVCDSGTPCQAMLTLRAAAMGLCNTNWFRE